MKYSFSLGLLFFIALLAGDGLAADAISKSDKTGAGNTWAPSEWDVQATLSYLPPADLHGVAGDAALADYRFKLTHNIKLDDRLSLTVGGGYGLKHIDAAPLAALPQDLHALFLEAGARYRFNDQFFASVKLIPGFYSDFKELGDDDLRMPVLALSGYDFQNGFSVVGGFIYRFGYHSTQFIPALGFSYQPDQYWRFDLVAPRPAITYSATRQWQFFIGGDFASDEYELKDHSLGATALKYSDLKALAGFNYLPVTAVKLSSSLGYAFERKFAFYNTTRPDMRIDDVPFFKISLDIGW